MIDKEIRKRSIHNLTGIGADAICKSDDMVPQTMTTKGC